MPCNVPTQTSVTCHSSEARLWVWIINKTFPFHSFLIILHQGHVCTSLVNCNHLFEPAPWFISSSLAPVGWRKCAWISKVQISLAVQQGHVFPECFTQDSCYQDLGSWVRQVLSLRMKGTHHPPHPVTSINSKALQWPQQSGFISDLTLAHILVCLSLKYKYTLLVKKIQLKFGQPKSPCQQVKKKKLQLPGTTLEVQWAAQALHKTELDRNARLWPWIFTSLADGTVHTAQASGNGCS